MTGRLLFAGSRLRKKGQGCVAGKDREERGAGKMEPREYIVASIDGDYANLVLMGEPDGEGKLVARALLPEEITEGCVLVYECLEYRVKE